MLEFVVREFFVSQQRFNCAQRQRLLLLVIRYCSLSLSLLHDDLAMAVAKMVRSLDTAQQTAIQKWSQTINVLISPFLV